MHKLFIRNIHKFIFTFTVTSLLFLHMTAVYADIYKASSNKYPVALIELFTSQGCSSCPPAEKWLNGLEKSGFNNNQVVPLALHVDYWDYIGWKDQFAQKYFSQRQYQYKANKHSASVYTPQIMFNGKDLRSVTLKNTINQLRQETAPVSFNLEASTSNTALVKLAIVFNRIDAMAKNSKVIVVLAENNLAQHIKSGENAGKKLRHEHVVRIWKNLGEIKSKYSIDLALDPAWIKNNMEVVVIVETADMQVQQVLQLALH